MENFSPNGNLYQRAIEQLTKMNHTVLQFQMHGKWFYFLCFKFSESYFSSSASVEYNVIEGVNITEFLERNGTLYADPKPFESALNVEMEKLAVMRCQFSKELPYIKWQIAK